MKIYEGILTKPITRPEDNKLISYSQYSTYKSCNFHWKLKYIDKIRPFTSSINTVFGTSIHEAIQQYLRIMFEKNIGEADKLFTDDYFFEIFSKNYEKEVESNEGKHFSTPEEFNEFYEDGLLILKWFRKHRSEYFSNKGYKFIGVEIPLMTPVLANSNVYFSGFIDLILYDEVDDRLLIYDIKTSTRGWRATEKKDPDKISQILLYKQYLSSQYEVPIDNIEVTYFIVKRKLWEKSDFPQKRIQIFTPAAGTRKISETNKSLETFIGEAFTKEGEYNTSREYLKNPGAACKWCPFSNKPELCNKKN